MRKHADFLSGFSVNSTLLYVCMDVSKKYLDSQPGSETCVFAGAVSFCHNSLSSVYIITFILCHSFKLIQEVTIQVCTDICRLLQCLHWFSHRC